MHFLTISKRSFDVAVAQHPDTGMHHEVRLGGVDQATDRGLPFLEVLLCLRQFLDVIGSIAQSQQLAPTR